MDHPPPPNPRTPPLVGLLLVDKPPGPTSMDVVRRVRREAGHRGRKHWVKCGHAGTLDPLASGLLIVCLGKATKLVPALMGMGKVYLATIDLSAFTTTDDLEGERENVPVDATPTLDRLLEACLGLTGMIQQRPPAYSAVHVDGQRAYKLARRGEAPSLPERPVRVDRFHILGYNWPHVQVEVACGKGTYIRSLARDLGIALGTGGHLTQLRRTAIGPYNVADATPLNNVPDPLIQADLRSFIEPTVGAEAPAPPPTL